MKHLTQSEYQSLPVNEKCNWKEDVQDIGNGGEFTPKIVYIPINPESVLNAEMGETTEQMAYDYMMATELQYDGENDAINGYLAGHSQGKKDRNKEVIDIVEAEIAKLPTNKMSQHAIYIDPKTTLTILLTKLKEIK